MPPLSPVPEDSVAYTHTPLPLPPPAARTRRCPSSHGSKESILSHLSASEEGAGIAKEFVSVVPGNVCGSGTEYGVYVGGELYGVQVGGEFYGPRITRGARGVGGDGGEAVTISSEMSMDDGVQPLYRRPWAIALYGFVLLVVIVLATVLGVLL